MANTSAPNKQNRSFVSMLGRIFVIVVRASPSWMILPNLIAIPYGAIRGFSIIVDKLFIDSVAGAVGKGIEVLLWPTLLLGGTLIMQQIFDGIVNGLEQPTYLHMTGKLNLLLAKKASMIDPIAFEEPAFLDDINKARMGASVAYGLVNNIMLFTPTFYGTYFIISGAMLFAIKPILLITLALVCIPTVLLQIMRAKLYMKLEEHAAPLRRQYEYYEKALSDRAYFKETRLLGAFAFFRGLYKETMGLLHTQMWRTEKKSVARELSLRLLSLIGYLGILILLFVLLMQGEISVGSFAAVFASIGVLFERMEKLICHHIGGMTQNFGMVRNFVRFLDMPERTGDTVSVDTGGGITLENVTFRYPGKEEDTLRGITLQVKAGETLAIVGSNGAGKSTLVRLMSGLYLPKEGSVKIGQTDTRNTSPRAVYQGISAVFQKFQRYRMTLDDNVDISQHAGQNTEEALLKADVNPQDESFPQGMNTMLSREFEGVDLSGGQWQRVAIARGYHRNHELILLDEPTAAIDPLQESKIYHQFAEISKGKTAVLVTHRMGSAKIADRICVLDGGRIVDIGTHEQLLSRGGLYATMWKAQAQWYE